VVSRVALGARRCDVPGRAWHDGSMAPSAALDELTAIVGPNHLTVEPDLMAAATVDWTGRFTGSADALIRPADAAQVAAVIDVCRRAGLAVYTQGGNTGLVGGAVPQQPGVVLSTGRIRHIEPVDHGQVTAGAGATLAEVQRAARTADWEYPVDLGARDSATIGGTVATNAGGIRVLRHGMTRRHVVGVECVTGAGEILCDLRGLAKDNTGYHLPSLLTGSEGTLAVISRVRLALVTPSDETAVALVPLPSNGAAVQLAARLGRHGEVTAIEYLRLDGCRLVAEHLGRSVIHPDWPVSILAEVQGPAGMAERMAELVEEHVPPRSAAEAVISTDARSHQGLWAWREGHTDALARRGTVHKLDVSVPPRHMTAFLDQVDDAVRADAPGAGVWVFGHLGDGNVHVNLSELDPLDQQADRVVLDLVSRLDGSISAEHGIGRAKRDELYRNRSPEELAVFARIKDAFDPDHVLNPGVLLPLRPAR